jgi:hypothetical protein
MNVRELINKLSKLDPELLVVLSKDAEGNSYDVCYSVEDNYSYFENEIKLHKLTPMLIDSGYNEEDMAGPEYKPCVVLWP